MRRFYCDKCGDEITDSVFVLDVRAHTEEQNGELKAWKEWHHVHLHEACASALMANWGLPLQQVRQ